MAEQTPGSLRQDSVEAIQARRVQVLERYEEFKDAARRRKDKLESAQKFQQFRRDADELEAWVNEKTRIASDESYKDRANFQVSYLAGTAVGYSSVGFVAQAKIQKHEAFEAEVAAHDNSIASFQNTGKIMISHGHFASEAIQVSEQGVSTWGRGLEYMHACTGHSHCVYLYLEWVPPPPPPPPSTV